MRTASAAVVFDEFKEGVVLFGMQGAGINSKNKKKLCFLYSVRSWW